MYFYSRSKKVISNNVKSAYIAEEVHEDEYCVEKILDKRLRNNKVEYFLKWSDYDDSGNTWEPEEHLHPNGKELIRDFEKRLKQTEKDHLKRGCKQKQPNSTVTSSASSQAGPSGTIKKRRYSSSPQPNKTNVNSEKSDLTENDNVDDDENSVSEVEYKHNNVLETTSFEKIPDYIVGIRKKRGQIEFFIKWKDVLEGDLILSKDAYLMYPQIVIQFYQERIEFNDP